MPTVFASVSATLILFYLVTLGMAYFHLLPVGFHMLWGLFTAILIVLLQCLVFGFFIGSGKTIKQKVQEFGLGSDWIQKTKDYKNRTYPALMMAILFTVTAAILGGGVSVGNVPVWVHQVLVWLALILNIRSLWISYQVVSENVRAIHSINEQIRLTTPGQLKPAPLPVAMPEIPAEGPRPNPSANYYFLAMAIWVPYLYMRWSLGSRSFPYWPFLVLSVLCAVWGWKKSRKNPSSAHN
ncbi:MAG TPA: hypothetical protein VMV05_00665 [bacterium]|nr:hypothetical protein [bacterium]